jgi:hypothetical protein
VPRATRKVALPPSLSAIHDTASLRSRPAFVVTARRTIYPHAAHDPSDRLEAALGGLSASLVCVG